MPLGFASLETSRSAMSSSERSLGVIAHNISNVNTKGYVRQQQMNADNLYINYGDGTQVGTGTVIQETRQIRHVFLDGIYRKENSTLGNLESKATTYDNIEGVLGEPFDKAMQYSLNQFWDSWQEVSKDPSSLTIRSLVRQSAQDLVDETTHIGTQLENNHTEANSKIVGNVNDINTKIKEIASLNNKILVGEANKDNANDLRDRRNLLIDDLTKKLNIDAYEQKDGQVMISNGVNVLVDKQNYYELSIITRRENLAGNIPISKDLTFMDVYNSNGMLLMPADGELKGQLDMQNQEIPDIIAKLDDYVRTIVTRINEVHKEGYTYGSVSHGEDFFQVEHAGYPLGFYNLKLNDNLSELDNIAVATSPESVGDNTNALNMLQIRNEKLFTDTKGQYTADEKYHNIILDIGLASQTIKETFTSQESLVQYADSQRQSIMAVSMDEEMASMLKFKYAYTASTRVFNVVDQMFDQIINRMGKG